MALFDFTLQTKEKDPVPTLSCVKDSSTKSESLNWDTGLLYANGQNLAREVINADLPKDFDTKPYTVDGGMFGYKKDWSGFIYFTLATR